MGFLQFLAFLLYSLFLYTQFTVIVTNCFPSVQLTNSKCHEDESAALLKFKASFVICKSASLNPLSYPKLESWSENTDCCSWYGVECDEHMGYVIGLDLDSSQLQGSLNPNSTLFHLVKLQSLNLADNNFCYSHIPSRLGNLLSLKYLNLSQFKFCGEIPAEISKLSNLLSLDLSSNDVSSFPFNRIQLKRDILRSMIQNLTKLKSLELDHVDISSPIPEIIMTNLSSVEKLTLFNCDLFGEFPIGMIHLPNLRFLDLGTNHNLSGYLPNFHSTSLIETLAFDGTSFHGTLPTSIGNLNPLKVLSLSFCKFSGPIPSSLSNITQITYLDLGHNNFKGYFPSLLSNLSQLYFLSIGNNKVNVATVSWIGKLTSLKYLDLHSVNIGSEITSYFANLSQISDLFLQNCNLSGEIPSWIMNLTNLADLRLTRNNLEGQIPPSLFEMQNLKSIHLCKNHLGGELSLSILLKIKGLTELCLSGINLSALTNGSSFNLTLPKFRFVGLTSCSLNEFPPFLKGQDELEILLLSDNHINDSLPSWLWTMKNLWLLDALNNSLIGELPH